MRDQTLDRADPQVVLFPELHQLRQARHRPVVVQDFAKDSGGLQASQPGQIDCCFSVTARAAAHLPRSRAVERCGPAARDR